MRKVFKYELTSERTIVQLPLGYQVLSGAVQNGNVMIWALVDDGGPKVPVEFFVGYTGESLPDGHWIFVETVFSGAIVLHVFRKADRGEIPVDPNEDSDTRLDSLEKEAEKMNIHELKSYYVCNTFNWMSALEARDEAQRERDALQAQVTAYEEHQAAEKAKLKSFREGLLITIDQVGDGNGPTSDAIHDIIEGFDAAFGDAK